MSGGSCLHIRIRICIGAGTCMGVYNCEHQRVVVVVVVVAAAAVVVVVVVVCVCLCVHNNYTL